MTDTRYKEIMENLGQPDSHSLLGALQQVANEVAQEATKNEREACASICHQFADLPAGYSLSLIRART